RLEEYRVAARHYRRLCDVIRDRGYILSGFLAGYRVCGSRWIDRFVFSPFYEDSHFAEFSGSGGLEGLAGKVKAGGVKAVVVTGSQWDRYGSSKDLPAGRVFAGGDGGWPA